MLIPSRLAPRRPSGRHNGDPRASASSWPSVIAEALLDALAVLSPIACAGCGRADRALCLTCRAALRPTVTPRSLPPLTVYTALEYTGAVRASLLALKENDRTDVARPLSRPLRAALSVVLRPGLELVSIPPSRAAWRRRGYDPVALLCRGAGFRRSRVLVSTRRTRSQKTLDEAARAVNLAGSLRATRTLTGRRFVVVDDVLTTGATIREAHRAITEAGGEVECGVTLAFTPRIFQRTPLAGNVHSDNAG
jgi:ComF family protein